MIEVKRKTGRYAHIDALRGIAVLLVIWIHVSESYRTVASPGSTWLYDWAHLLNVGRIGVVIFFAISGFVISHSIKGDLRGGTRRFWIRRFFRLYPLFWLSMIAGGAVLAFGWGVSYDLPTVLANSTMLPLFFSKPMILGLYWTLEVELIFYLLCWGLFLIGRVRDPRALFGMMLASIVYFALTMKFHWYSQAHIGSSILGLNLAVMFWGALFRIWFDDRDREVRFGTFVLSMKRLLGVATLFLLTLPTVSLVSGVLRGDDHRIRFALGYLWGVGLFLLFNRFPLRHRLLVGIGIVSYSVYLFHPVVFNLLLATLDTPYGLPAHWPLEIYLLINVVGSVLLAMLLYRIVEKPANDLGHRLG